MMTTRRSSISTARPSSRVSATARSCWWMCASLMNSPPATFRAPCRNPSRRSTSARSPPASGWSSPAGRRPVGKGAESRKAAGLDIREHYKGGFKDWAAAGEPVELSAVFT